MKLPYIGDIEARRVSTISNLKANCDSYGTGFWNHTKQRYEILIDSESYERWYKSAQFTIAEELGHVLVHWEHLKNIQSLQERIQFEQSIDEGTHLIFEKQAKNVGSALLLPSSHFNSYVIAWAIQQKSTLLKTFFPNENDIALHISLDLAPALNLSSQIVQRALMRKVPNTLISDIVSSIGIKLNTPR